MPLSGQDHALARLDAILPAPKVGIVRGFAIAAAAAALGVLLRIGIDPWVQGLQFVTLFLAVVLTALLGGSRSGLIAVILSALGWWFFLAPSPQAGAVGRADLIALGMFLSVGSILAVAVGTMRSALSEARLAASTLEMRVRERTQDLEKSQDSLRKLALELEALVGVRTRELQQSRDLLGSVIDGIPDIVFLYDARGDDVRFVYTNVAGERLLNRARDEIIGMRDVELIDPAHAAENRQILEDGVPAVFRERFLETPEGPRCFEVRKFPLKHATPSESALLTILRDITDVRKLEDTLRQTQRLDALGKLTGGVAHDFNNLLAIAIGNLDLLDDEVPLEADARELLEAARNACLRGAELTGHLLAFARKQSLQPVATEVNKLISDYAKLLVRLLGDHIDLRLDLAPGLWRATVDRGQLETAITNLATNARDAMPRGGRLTISTRNEILDSSYTDSHPDVMPGEYVAVEVGDTGRGMTPDVRARAVEPFFTTKEEGKGTGLGLSMVFGFAKQSGGHVRIYSEIGRGTHVTLLLPRSHEVSAPDEIGKPSAPRAKAGESVLVVDDNAKLLSLAVRQLTALGYRVVEAVDGPSALKALREDPAIELVLTDIIMPGGLSGVELGREARRIRPQVKLLYMSGFPETAFDEEARLDPGVRLLRKPFRQAELAGQIRKVLDASE